jgi:hypothetical protein
MAKILEEIQARLTEAHTQLAEATQILTIAQQKHQAATHNFNVWNAAMQLEQREEQLRQDAATEKQSELPLSTPRHAALVSVTPTVEQSADTSETLNKTDVVRNLLRQHPTGMSAVDIWKEVRPQFTHRPYLYSVLKRLRDKEEVVKRRNKYCLTAISKVEGVKEHSVVH